MEETIFEKIVRREIPAEIVDENEHVLAFLDIHPVNKGHTLVIPKHPYPNVYETPDEVLNEVIRAVKKVAISLKKTLNADGINIHVNNEEAAGQVVFHLHFHVIPRFKEDGHEEWTRTHYIDNEARELQQKIVDNIQREE